MIDYRGKVVVVTFWASWCGACLNHFPIYNQVSQEYQESDFILLGVNSDAVLSDALAAEEANRISFHSWWDDPAVEPSITKQWGVTAWPTTFVLDRNGRIRYKNLPIGDLSSAIQRLLEE